MEPEEPDIRAEFVGREREISAFYAGAQSGHNSSSPKLLVYHGIGGIGKTWLLKRLHSEANSRNWQTALIDVGSSRNDYLSILTRITHQFPLDLVAEFTTELERYRLVLRERYLPWQDMYSEARLEPNLALADLAGAGLSTLQFGAVAGILDGMKADLEGAFLDSITKVVRNTPVCLMFDTLEYIESSDLIQWLRDLCVRAAARGCLCILAGRNRLRITRAQRLAVRQFEVSYFPESEVEQYLRVKRHLQSISSADVHHVYQLTGGHPLCLGLAGDLLSDVSGTGAVEVFSFGALDRELGNAMVSELLTDRILQRESPAVVTALMAAGVTRSFDAGTLAEIGLVADAQLMVDSISRYSFVVAADRGYKLHDIVRRLLLVKWLRDNYAGFVQANVRAVAYFERLMDINPGSKYSVEASLSRLFHLLIVDENRGMADFQDLFDAAESRQQREYCESLLQEVAMYSSFLNDVVALVS